MKNLIKIILFLSIGATSLVSTAQEKAQENKKSEATLSLEQRIMQLEEQQKSFDRWYSEYYLESKGRVSPFLGESISFGGFFENAITHMDGPNMPLQTTTNSHTLGFNIAATFNEKMKFVSQYLIGLSYTLQNPHNNPALTPSQRQFSGVSFGALPASAYFEYTTKDAFVIQTGLGYVPFGQAYQMREPVLFVRRGGPQLAGTTDIAFPLWMGVHLSGSFTMNDDQVGYNVYTFSPYTNAKTLGVGSRLWWADQDGITAGVSWQYAEQAVNSYYAYAADLKIEGDRSGFTLEYARQVQSGGFGANESYYIEPFYNFADGSFVVYATADYIDNRTRVVAAVADPYKKWVTGGGINWLPVPNARFRIGFLQHKYVSGTNIIGGQQRDYNSIDLSTGIAF